MGTIFVKILDLKGQIEINSFGERKKREGEFLSIYELPPPI